MKRAAGQKASLLRMQRKAAEMSIFAKMFFVYGLTAIVSMAVAVLIKLMTSVLSSLKKAPNIQTLEAKSVSLASVSTVVANNEKAEIIAVIAAAVYAAMGSTVRIVWIREAKGRNVLWTASSRLAWQTSHGALIRHPPYKML